MQQDTVIPFERVDTKSGLNKIIKSFQGANALAVDLEADSMFHYKEKVCLIQIASTHHLFIVDPIPIKDLSVLKPLFKNPGIKKVFHGCDYDVRSLFRDFGIIIHNLFDTELACRFLGFQQSGLDAVLQTFFNVKLQKKYQKKDWSKRPLPEAMVSYAANDVHHLLSLAETLKKQLIEKNRLTWVEEECALLSKVRPNTNTVTPLFLSFKGAGRLSPQDLAVLEAILNWRKQTARKKDLPLFKIIGSHPILTLIKKKPQTKKSLEMCGALSARQVDMYGHPLMDAIGKGLKTPDDSLPVYPRTRTPRMPESKIRIAKRLKLWKEKRASSLAIDPSLVLNKSQTMDIARAIPASVHDLEAIDSLKSWQIHEFGEEIIGCIK